MYGVFLCLALSCTSEVAYDAKLEPVGHLPSQLKECSGLVSLGNNEFIGLNDSGNPAELVMFSLADTSEPRIIKINGANNHDWEELAADDRFIYIGDVGNNLGNRKNLGIYRVQRDHILSETEVAADQIRFDYPEQKKFLPVRKHNFDCEAMICVGDSLYLFTKNRKNHKTDLYRIPKIPGTYHAKHLGQFDANGLVTGAAFRSSDAGNELALVGYTDENKGYHPFIVYFDHVDGTHFFEASAKRFVFDGKEQTESILFADGQHVLLSNEENHGSKGFVYQVDIKN